MEKVYCPNCDANNLHNARYCSQCGHELPQTLQEPPISELQPVKTTKPSNKKKIRGLIIFALTFALGFAVTQLFFFKSPSYDKIMMSAASELNKTCPVMVDRETRLDNVVSLPDNIFQYNYTLVNFEKSAIDTNTLKPQLEPNVINFVKTSPQMKIQRDHKTTLVYNYRDKAGIYIFSISVTPEMYQ